MCILSMFLFFSKFSTSTYERQMSALCMFILHLHIPVKHAYVFYVLTYNVLWLVTFMFTEIDPCYCHQMSRYPVWISHTSCDLGYFRIKALIDLKSLKWIKHLFSKNFYILFIVTIPRANIWQMRYLHKNKVSFLYCYKKANGVSFN